MTSKTIYVVHSPSPTLGRSPLQRGYFPYAITDKFIKSLQLELDRLDINCRVIADDTESDVEVLITREPILLVCAPGLRYQFYHRGLRQTEYCLVRRHGVFLRRSPFCAQQAWGTCFCRFITWVVIFNVAEQPCRNDFDVSSSLTADLMIVLPVRSVP